MKSLQPLSHRLITLLYLGLILAAAGERPGLAANTQAADQAQGHQSTEIGVPVDKPDPNDKRPYSKEAVAHYNRGVELHQSGFLNKAIDEYRGAIEADPRMEEAYSNLGGIYAAQRSYAKALEAFEKALAIKPDRPTTLNGYGTVLYAKGKIEEAKEIWRKAIAADPKFASAYYNMGNAFESEKKSSDAIGCYVKALEVQPTMADAYYRAGSILLKERHPAQAKVLLQKALELSPDGDFARDARKQVSSLAPELSDASGPESEVQMNVVAPAPGGSAPQYTEAEGPPVTSDERKTASASTAAEANPQDQQPKHNKLGLFKHKEKQPPKKMDMFVQPGAAAASAPAEQDLKAMPSGEQ